MSDSCDYFYPSDVRVAYEFIPFSAATVSCAFVDGVLYVLLRGRRCNSSSNRTVKLVRGSHESPVDHNRDVLVLRGGSSDAVPGAVHVGQTLERSVPFPVLSGAQLAGPMVLHVPVVHPRPVPVGLHTRDA